VTRRPIAGHPSCVVHEKGAGGVSTQHPSFDETSCKALADPILIDVMLSTSVDRSVVACMRPAGRYYMPSHCWVDFGDTIGDTIWTEPTLFLPPLLLMWAT
jgi:hypothetical protein